MTGADTDADGPEAGDAADASSSGAESIHTDESDGAPLPRLLVLALVGLIAGLAGGIVATTVAPDSVLVTILLIVLVVVGVTHAAFRLLGS